MMWRYSRAAAAAHLVLNLDRPPPCFAAGRAASLRAMKGEYGQFCPVALASEVLAERWTLLIVRELLAGAGRFNELRRGVPRLSATLLKQRLQTLEHAGILERRSGVRGSSYGLTEAGLALRPVVTSIGEWGQRWARDLRPQDLDPGWLVWTMHRRLNTAAMPRGRTVIEIEFIDAGGPQRWFWLVHTGGGNVEVCLKDPGYEPAVRVITRVRVLAEVWRGIRSLKQELRAGNIQLQGSTTLRRAFPDWLLLSVYAPIKRAR
jgi:DNA-binding HxlR family transcriptional regulator